jgi:hypothetical protein
VGKLSQVPVRVRVCARAQTLGGNFGTKADDTLTIPPNLAALAWRLTHTSYLGLSKLEFRGPLTPAA